MIWIGDLMAMLRARAFDKRQAPEPTPPVPEDPDLARQAEAWAEPENEAPLFANAHQPEKTPRSKGAESPEAEVR